jgi:hypothetical protein
MQSNLQNIQQNNYERLLRIMIKKYAAELTYRENKEGIDTFLLGETISIDKRTFQPDVFSDLYAAIALRFNEIFANVTFYALPFWKDGQKHIDFLTSFWESYFLTEIGSIIFMEPSFAIKIIEITIDPGQTAQNNDLLDRMLMDRYADGREMFN